MTPTKTLTDRNHSATILADGDELKLFFDNARFPIAVVRFDPGRGTLHMFSDMDDANGDYPSMDRAYAALLDWAQTDIREMADQDEDNEEEQTR